jgi:hypothetical protein
MGVGVIGIPDGSLTYCGLRLQPPLGKHEKHPYGAGNREDDMVNLASGATTRWAMLQ